MARNPGVVVQDRDRKVLGVLAMAGALTAKQLHLACEDTGRLDHFTRRLARLSGAEGGARLIERFVPPPPHQGQSSIYMLAPDGAHLIGFHDEGAPSLEVKMAWSEVRHFEMTGSVFLTLMDRHKGEDPLPFIWRADRGQCWHFKGSFPTGPQGQLVEQNATVRPDGIVESPRFRARVFLEVETGAHSVNGVGTGSVVRKLQRYAAFASGFAEGVQPPTTWYRRAFSDERFPVVMVVTHNAARAARVRDAIAADPFVTKLGLGDEKRFGWKVVTVEEAPLQIERYMNGQDPLSPAEVRRELGLPSPGSGPLAPFVPRGDETLSAEDLTWVRMSAEGAKQLKDDVRSLITEFNAYYAVLKKIRERAPKPWSDAARELLAAERFDSVAATAKRCNEAIDSLRSNHCRPPPAVAEAPRAKAS